MDLLLPPAGYGGTALSTLVVAGNASVNERSAARAEPSEPVRRGIGVLRVRSTHFPGVGRACEHFRALVTECDAEGNTRSESVVT